MLSKNSQRFICPNHSGKGQLSSQQVLSILCSYALRLEWSIKPEGPKMSRGLCSIKSWSKSLFAGSLPAYTRQHLASPTLSTSGAIRIHLTQATVCPTSLRCHLANNSQSWPISTRNLICGEIWHKHKSSTNSHFMREASQIFLRTWSTNKSGKL